MLGHNPGYVQGTLSVTMGLMVRVSECIYKNVWVYLYVFGRPCVYDWDRMVCGHVAYLYMHS